VAYTHPMGVVLVRNYNESGWGFALQCFFKFVSGNFHLYLPGRCFNKPSWN